MRVLVLAVAVLAATPVFAAEKPAVAPDKKEWVDAPVPGTANTGMAPPAERAGRSSGPDNASPFSGIPSGAAAAGGQTSSNSTAAPDVGTPSVSR